MTIRNWIHTSMRAGSVLLVAVGAGTVGASPHAGAATAPGPHAHPAIYSPYFPEGIALTGVGSGSVQSVSTPVTSAATGLTTTVVGSSVLGTSVSPDGSLGLVSTFSSTASLVSGPWTGPILKPSIDLSQFTGEGGAGYNVYTSGDAFTPDGKAALVSADSQGMIQLLRSGSTLAVDTRFTAPGLNQAGNPHQPGWILAPTTTPTATTYDGVVISDIGGGSSGYTALALDAGENRVGVITGVGTAGVKFAGTLYSTQIAGVSDDAGNGGMSFDPMSRGKATIRTSTGFGVVDLSNPSAPTLGSLTALGGAATSTAVAPDGDHVVVARGSTLSFFSGLATANPASPLTASGTPLTFPGAVQSVQMDRTGDVVVEYVNGSASDVAFVENVGTASPDVFGTATLSGLVGDDNTMSMWPSQSGYNLVASDGGIFSFGDASFYGSAGSITLNKPVVGMAMTPDHKGYWLVASDGGIFSYGDAGFHGSTGSLSLNKPIVGMTAMYDGMGYWLLASDGGIFAFGDAKFYGSTGGSHLNQPIVGMAMSADYQGYWLVAADGGIFAYGSAKFHGSAGGSPLNRPIVGMSATFDGGGYWLVASDGGIFSYGDASFHGSTGGLSLNRPIVGMATTPDGGGYWLLASDGGIFAFGDARFSGSTGGIALNKPIVGMAFA